jgi:hypothetical protein
MFSGKKKYPNVKADSMTHDTPKQCVMKLALANFTVIFHFIVA